MTPIRAGAPAKLVIATVLWGLLFTASKPLSAALPPFSASFGRYGLAALALFGLAWPELRQLPRAAWPALLGVGLLGSTLFNALIFFGLRFTPAADAMIAPAAVPLMAALAGMLWANERPERLRGWSLGLMAVGLVTLFMANRGAGGPARLVGDGLLLGASAAYTAYVLLAARAARRYSALVITTATTLAGTLVALPLAWAEGGLGRFGSLSALGWAELLYMGLGGTAIAILIWNQGARELGGARASVYMALVPVANVASAMLLLHERIGGLQALAIGLLLTGMVGASLAWPRSPRGESPAPP